MNPFDNPEKQYLIQSLEIINFVIAIPDQFVRMLYSS